MHAVNSRYVFIHKKPDTLRCVIFHEIFEIGIYIYTKSMTLCVICRFYIQKYRHFKKIKTVCVTVIYIQKSWHFVLRNFSWNFWYWRKGGGGIFINKNNALCVQILYAKKCIFCYVLIYKKPDTLRHICISKKQYTLPYVYIYIIYCIVYSDN